MAHMISHKPGLNACLAQLTPHGLVLPAMWLPGLLSLALTAALSPLSVWCSVGRQQRGRRSSYMAGSPQGTAGTLPRTLFLLYTAICACADLRSSNAAPRL